MQTNTQLADWAVRKIESEYKEDVCLLLEHKTLRLEKDQDQLSFSFYIPATSRANGLAQSFMIQGLGYDLFPMSWERIERMADVKEYNTTCLADAVILYARSEEDRRRFESLRAKLRANLQNPHWMRQRALEWVDVAVEAYREMLFEPKLYKVRENAGHICDVLSIAVAFANGAYFPHGQTRQLKALKAMARVPEGFAALYERVIRERNLETQKALCHEMIALTKQFLSGADQGSMPRPSEPDFSELAAWYHELSYTWRRVYHWCAEGDPVNAYLWACNLQGEVERVGEEFGIEDRDILGSFDAQDLPAFQKRAAEVERGFLQAMEENGAKLDHYATVEAFLERNP